jgi:2,4-dienoyl-CoA reductase-like NADH-dependent reductase (Old Yellow Enzyme family)
MTRSRSPNEIANDLNALHYAQRTTPGGLIISEATTASKTGVGYAAVPALMNEEQAKGWALTTRAVHDRGGYIFAQLWYVNYSAGRSQKLTMFSLHFTYSFRHVGRVSAPKFQPGGKLP